MKFLSTKPLKEIGIRMEDGPIKAMIMDLPDEVERADLISKMDVILPFLINRGVAVK